MPTVRSLSVIVMECRSLKRMDLLGKNDVFVKLFVNDRYGLSSNKMALLTSDSVKMCSPTIKWP